MNSLNNLLSHPQLRTTILEQLHHGTICMISMTCKHLLYLHRNEGRDLTIKLKQTDGECVNSVSMIQYTNLLMNEKLLKMFVATGCNSLLAYLFDKGATKGKI